MGSRRSVRQHKGRKGARPSSRYDEELERLELERLAHIEDPMEQKVALQLRSLDLRFQRYLRELPASHILRYEDITASNGRALEILVPTARQLDESLRNMNVNPLYDWEYMLKIGERLLESEGAYWHLYSREDVEELLGQIRREVRRGS